MTHTNADATKGLAALPMLYDAAKPVVTSVPPLRPQPHFPQWQVQIIADDQHALA